jgi:hypothetical protein
MTVGIGRRDSCLFRLDSPGDSDLVHVEAPGHAIFRLGQFFQIWEQPPDSIQFWDSRQRTSDNGSRERIAATWPALRNTPAASLGAIG